MSRLRLGDNRGAVLILTFIIMTTLAAITITFLYMTSIQTKTAGYDIVSHKAFWLAEAGIQKAVWNLKTPVANGGQGEDWLTAGTTESLGGGTYTMVVEKWDFALSDNGATASATSQQAGNGPAKAIDGNSATFWQSNTAPTVAAPQDLIITFPYTLTINKVYFKSSPSSRTPEDFSWWVSTDGVDYGVNPIVNVTGNASLEVENTFTAVSNVNYLKLRITKTIGGVNSPVRIAVLEARGRKITSTGTVDSLDRQIAQTVVADETTQTAYDEIDWNEL